MEPGPQQNPAVEIGTGSIGQGSAVPRWGEQELLDHLRPSGSRLACALLPQFVWHDNQVVSLNNRRHTNTWWLLP